MGRLALQTGEVQTTLVTLFIVFRQPLEVFIASLRWKLKDFPPSVLISFPFHYIGVISSIEALKSIKPPRKYYIQAKPKGHLCNCLSQHL